MIFFIVLGAAVFNAFLGLTRLPFFAAGWVGGLEMSPYWVLLVILLIYLVFGCVMDSLSMILLTIPIFFPIVMRLDFGLTPEETALWFGVIVLIVVEVGIDHAAGGDEPVHHQLDGARRHDDGDLSRRAALRRLGHHPDRHSGGGPVDHARAGLAAVLGDAPVPVRAQSG
jgi:hypothetical protein